MQHAGYALVYAVTALAGHDRLIVYAANTLTDECALGCGTQYNILRAGSGKSCRERCQFSEAE